MYANMYGSMHTSANKQLICIVWGSVEHWAPEQLAVTDSQEGTEVVESASNHTIYIWFEHGCFPKNVRDDIGIVHDCTFAKITALVMYTILE